MYLLFNYYNLLKAWLKISRILTANEQVTLVNMTNSSNGTLLYRATRDGFTAKAFHQKCDGKTNTITIIKTDGNYVFGGYTFAEWNNDGHFITDPNAFIFSLRRNGVSNDQKFLIKNDSIAYAINSWQGYGPWFGFEFSTLSESNVKNGSSSYFCTCYQCPSEYLKLSINFKKTFLAGSHMHWLTTEIEVYQITN
jgi:hypothetical protein